VWSSNAASKKRARVKQYDNDETESIGRVTSRDALSKVKNADLVLKAVKRATSSVTSLFPQTNRGPDSRDVEASGERVFSRSTRNKSSNN